MDTETYLQVEMSDYYTKDPEYANATIPVYVIQKPRSDTENMVILFCAEGYTKSQQADFIQDVQKLWQATLNTEPYRSMADRFNVYALCTASKEGFGGNTFFRANTDGISTNFGNWRNHIFERIIGTSFLERSMTRTSPTRPSRRTKITASIIMFMSTSTSSLCWRTAGNISAAPTMI